MKTGSNDLIYYRERERHCREMARKASDPAVQEVHERFAQAYAARARSVELPLAI